LTRFPLSRLVPLLNKGADINAHGGKYGNALQAASLRGNVAIVQLLLDKGADINAREAMLCRQHHPVAMKQLFDCCWSMEQTHTTRRLWPKRSIINTAKY
jgi:hypothetical protein